MPILPGQQDRDEQYERMGETGHPKHPTYYQKPTPAMQLVSQSSQFNDRTRASLDYQNHDEVIRNPGSIPAVPTTWDTAYDPAHPDSDWSGLVSRTRVQKKHSHDHSSQRENIVRTEHGIVSREERADFGRKKAPEDASVAIKNTMGSIVIGGVDRPDERWRTTHQRLDQREPTQRDQLILEKRTSAIKHHDPAQAHAQVRSQYATDSPRAYEGAGTVTRAPAGGFSGRGSLLSGIASKLDVEPLQRPVSRPVSGYEHTNRVLVVDNYKPYAPGYTGGRRG